MADRKNDALLAALNEGGQEDDQPVTRNNAALLARLNPEEPSALDRALALGDMMARKASRFAGSMGRGFNSELAGLLGLPGDAAEALFGLAGLSAEFAGREDMALALQNLGIEQPQGNEGLLAENIGRATFGAGLASVAVMGRAAQLSPKLPANLQLRNLKTDVGGPVPVSPGRGTVGQAFDEVAATAGRAPHRFLAEEGLATAGAGAGLTAAQTLAPGSAVARTGGELLGGGLPGLVTGTAGIVSRETLGLLPGSTEKRVAQFFQEVAGGRGPALEKADRLRDAESVSGKLTSAQTLEDTRMLALERSVIRENAEVKSRFQDKMNAADAALSDAIQNLEPGELTKVIVDEFFMGRIDTAMHLTNARLKQATAEARRKISELPPTVAREQANRLARELIDDAEVTARDTESHYWSNVKEDFNVQTTHTKAVANDIRTSFRERVESTDDLPKDILDKIDALEGVETLGDLQKLRSNILETTRTRRAGDTPRRKLVANLTRLQEAILDDLGVTQSAMQKNIALAQQTATAPTSISARNQITEAAKLKAALDYSRQLNDKFTRGPVGKILGFDRTGAQRTSEAVTLERILGKGIAGKEQAAAIIDAVGGAQRMNELMEDFLRDTFLDSVGRTDANGNVSLDQASYQRFMKRHKELIDEFPEMKTQFEDAAQAEMLLQKRATQQRRTTSQIERSKAGLWTETDDIHGAFTRILNSPSVKAIGGRNVKFKSAVESMRRLVRSASKDETGQALSGLRREFSNYLLERVRKGDVSPLTDAPKVGAKAVSEFIRKNRPVLNELYTPEQMKALGRIGDEFLQIQRSADSRLAGGSDTFENLSVMQTIVARVVGARLGARAAAGTPGGSIQAAQIGARAVKALVNRLNIGDAMRLIEDAILDPKKMEEMLRMNVRSAPKEAMRKFRGYLLEAGIPDPSVLEPEPEDEP